MRSRLSHARLTFTVTLLPLLTVGLSSSAAAGPQDPAAPPAAGIPVATAPPLPNRVNDRLPPWISVRGEFRGRLEGLDNAGFTIGRDDLYWLNRFRFDVGVTPIPGVAVHVQVQDARVARKQLAPAGAPFRAPVDLRLAYLEFAPARSGISVRLGRQELVFGDQRLVGHVSWLNAARSFDGARVTMARGPLQLQAFAASVVRVLDPGFDRSGNGSRFFGVDAARRWTGGVAIEPYVYWRGERAVLTEAGPPGPLRSTTLGVRASGHLGPRLDFGVEQAIQGGSAGADGIRAWAGHYLMRAKVTGALGVVAEYNAASGDAESGDGRRGTFDQLFPTPHDKYGLADQVGWRNIRHVRAGLDLSRWKGLPIALHYHSWWLAERRDGLYAAGGALIARIPDGARSRHVGQELDVQVTHALTPQLQLAAGYAHVISGAFLHEATPGASFHMAYAMVTYVFLADR